MFYETEGIQGGTHDQCPAIQKVPFFGIAMSAGWQKLWHEGPSSKSLDSDENFKPKHTLFCRELKFTHFLEIFGQRKCLFGSKTVFLGQEVHYYMVYIAYFSELILQICD